MAVDPPAQPGAPIAGAVAAGVWAAQQPLDKRVFALAATTTSSCSASSSRAGPGGIRPASPLHLGNGAVFGALYANLAPLVPLPGAARGASWPRLVEHFGLWPLGRLSDRLHPARAELPVLTGNRRALWQATWRHALFGAVLGELERRLNGAARDARRPTTRPSRRATGTASSTR